MSHGNGAAATPLSIFSSREREQLLKLVVGKRTGVLVTLGGVTFDLLPFTAAEGLSAFVFIRRFADLTRRVGKNALSVIDFAEVVGADGPAIAALLHIYLARCAGLRLEPKDPQTPQDALELADLQIADQDEKAGFELWFSQLPLAETVRTLFPHFMEANGLVAVTRPPADAPSSANSGEMTPEKASTPSTSSTSSGSS